MWLVLQDQIPQGMDIHFNTNTEDSPFAESEQIKDEDAINRSIEEAKESGIDHSDIEHDIKEADSQDERDRGEEKLLKLFTRCLLQTTFNAAESAKKIFGGK